MHKLSFKLFIVIVFFAGIYFSSCKHETTSLTDIGYNYFPSNTGHWILYDVDSTYYDGFTHTINHSHFQIREKTESTFLDNQNRITQRVERYKKMNDTTNWFIKDVWVSNLTPSTAEKVEENFRYVKLVFPISDGKTWNGNAFNTMDAQDYEYDNVFKPYKVNAITYDSTVTVIQKIDDFLTQESYQVEVYAAGIGLIYKKYKEVTKLYPTPPNLGHDSITGGVDYTYKIVSYGN